jgi:hypothetical protein
MITSQLTNEKELESRKYPAQKTRSIDSVSDSLLLFHSVKTELRKHIKAVGQA